MIPPVERSVVLSYPKPKTLIKARCIRTVLFLCPKGRTNDERFSKNDAAPSGYANGDYARRRPYDMADSSSAISRSSTKTPVPPVMRPVTNWLKKFTINCLRSAFRVITYSRPESEITNMPSGEPSSVNPCLMLYHNT